MATLRLLVSGAGPSDPGGEVLACAYTPDGAFVLSGGFDGQLRLWDAATGAHVTAVAASPKPISACAVAPDGKFWVSGSLLGMVAFWDPVAHTKTSEFLAHPRPVSAITFGPDERTVVTSSWDGSIAVWKSIREREGRLLPAHKDIAAGCAVTPDGLAIWSWAHDGMVRLWDLSRHAPAAEWAGHADRATAGAVAPDGRWAASGGRDGTLRLWDLQELREAGAAVVPAEVRCCRFLLDARALVVVDAAGRLTLHEIPTLQEQMELATRLPVQCAELSPNGGQLALGCGDGKVRFVAVDGFDSAPLVVHATQTDRREASLLQRLFGKSDVVRRYSTVCPVCRLPLELASGAADQQTPCPHCRRRLRVSGVVRVVKEGEPSSPR